MLKYLVARWCAGLAVGLAMAGCSSHGGRLDGAPGGARACARTVLMISPLIVQELVPAAGTWEWQVDVPSFVRAGTALCGQPIDPAAMGNALTSTPRSVTLAADSLGAGSHLRVAGMIRRDTIIEVAAYHRSRRPAHFATGGQIDFTEYLLRFACRPAECVLIEKKVGLTT